MAYHKSLKCLESIERYAARPIRTHSNRRSRYTCICPICNYDNGRDTFSCNENGQLWKCWVCHSHGNAYQLYQILSGAIPSPVNGPIASPPAGNRPRPHPAEERPKGCTINDLANAKGLSQEWVRRHLGWADSNWYSIPAVEIPYYDENGQDPQIRYRVGLRGDRFRWAKGASPRLYNLWSLPRIQERSMCILVEGETDTATLASNGYDVLGLPGVDTFKPEWAKYLQGIKHLYVWQEPDKGGDTLLSILRPLFSNLRVIKAPEGIKDPTELVQLAGDKFVERFEALLDAADQAGPLPPPSTGAPAPLIVKQFLPETVYEEMGTCFNPGVQVSLPHLSQERVSIWFDERKEIVMSHKRMSSSKNALIEAQRLEHCYEHYGVWRCQTTKQEFLRRMRCGLSCCEVCSIWLIAEFLKEKQDTLEEYLDYPVIYRIGPIGMRLPEDKVEREAMMRGFSAKVLEWCRHLVANYGEDYWVAANHIRGERSLLVSGECEGIVVHVQYMEILIYSRHEQNARAMLSEHFSQQSGCEGVRVEELRFADVRHSIDVFSRLMATRVDFSTGEQFELWMAANKGKKKLQGVGVFYKCSGSKPKGLSKQEATWRNDCPVCGECKALQLTTTYRVADVVGIQVVSAMTGRVYIVLDTGQPAELDVDILPF